MDGPLRAPDETEASDKSKTGGARWESSISILTDL